MNIQDWIKSDEGKDKIKMSIIHNDELDLLQTTYTDIMRKIKEDNIGFDWKYLDESILKEPFEKVTVINASNEHARAYLIINSKYKFFPDAKKRPTFYSMEVSEEC